jgi:hypothetical protein
MKSAKPKAMHRGCSDLDRPNENHGSDLDQSTEPGAVHKSAGLTEINAASW